MEGTNKITISNQQSNLQIIKSVSSNVVSSLSSGMFSYGLGFMLLHNTHSPLSFGLDVAIAPIIGLLFFIPIGNYVDHHQHKHILIGSYILRMILLVMFAMALPLFSGTSQLFPVAIFIALDAILSNYRTTTYSAAIHELVNDDRISALNSFTQAASAYHLYWELFCIIWSVLKSLLGLKLQQP